MFMWFMLPRIPTSRRIQFGSCIICIIYIYIYFCIYVYYKIYIIFIYIHTHLIRHFCPPFLVSHAADPGVLQPEYLHWILHCPGEIIEFLRCIAAIIGVLAMTSWGRETVQHIYIIGFQDWFDLRTQRFRFIWWRACSWWFATPHLDRLFVSICSACFTYWRKHYQRYQCGAMKVSIIHSL